MSRIGKQPIKLIDGVKAEITPTVVKVSGPLGELTVPVPRFIVVKESEGKLLVEKTRSATNLRALHGLTRSLLQNAVSGVSAKFTKVLEIRGVGYRAKKEGENLILSLGFSHPVEVPAVPGIAFEIKGSKIEVSGIDKQLVGQIAANIRKIKGPDVYKGKGIRYEGEEVIKKAGKAAKTAAA